MMAGRLTFGTMVLLLSGGAWAEPVSVAALLSPTDQVRMDFQGSNRFVLLVRREGMAEDDATTPPFEGASVVEHGWHDVDPPAGADPHGYLTLTTPAGDIAYVRFTVRAVFLGGADTPQLRDHGFWELAGGTGRFENARGIGTVVIQPKGAAGTRFILEGEIGDSP